MIEEHVMKEHLQNMSNSNELPFEESSSGSEAEEVAAKTNPKKTISKLILTLIFNTE